MGQPQRWSIDYDVRDDADSVFIPAELIPDGRRGDLVTITSTRPEVTREGRIVAWLEDARRGDYFTVELGPPIEPS